MLQLFPGEGVKTSFKFLFSSQEKIVTGSSQFESNLEDFLGVSHSCPTSCVWPSCDLLSYTSTAFEPTPSDPDLTAVLLVAELQSLPTHREAAFTHLFI